MTTAANDSHAADRKLLSVTSQFQRLPDQIQRWIMNSPLASAQFAEFFRDGGEIVRDPNESLAAYLEQTSGTGKPAIKINPAYYPLVNLEGKDTILQEGDLFAVLAHEIGHHRINSRTHAFAGSTYEDNIQYRAEHEAMTVLNAFKIFDELRERDASYRPRYGSIGYGFDASIGAAYSNWRQHHDAQATIIELSSIVCNSIDTRTEKGFDNVPDYNGDQIHTHEERFRRDWEQSEKRRLNSPAHDNAPSERDLSLPQVKPPQAFTPYSDPHHRDHALHEAIRRHLPAGTSDEMAAHVTLQAKVGRVRDAEHVDVVMVHEGRVFVMSKTPGFRAHVDLSETPPPINETMQRSESLDAQRAQQREQWMAQEQQLSQGRGLSRSL